MTEISKGEDLPGPGQPGWGGAGPSEIPHGVVGKSSGTGTDSVSGAVAREEIPALPPRRIGLADGGWWAGLVAPSPAPSAATATAAGMLGGQFDDIAYAGRGAAALAMDETPPPGYVLVDVVRTGPGLFLLDSLDWNGRDAVHFGGGFPPHRFGRWVMWCDTLYPLRFRVQCDSRDEWVVVVRPLGAARALGDGATGRGADVLLHTGPAGELVLRAHSTQGGSLRVEGHKPRRPGAPTSYPQTLASAADRRPEDARPLPEGPLVLGVVEGDGDWSLDIRPARPSENRTGLWNRLRGRRAD
ncbi:hypothetical protein MHW47_11030 [Streptomyces sp. OfavH-34-F]|uniref:hypothetical protein n=1 Tax=Streptomyces sp. OfavH-34-F TaxID=2917760 RepID=UPI001EF39986|nr:hypothetical protein [Streptomyces sp. OfavH-34-F]MCG7524968.1 hypothetical protein [Streptomyces sp. OfavH-34-F]